MNNVLLIYYNDIFKLSLAHDRIQTVHFVAYFQRAKVDHFKQYKLITITVSTTYTYIYKYMLMYMESQYN